MFDHHLITLERYRFNVLNKLFIKDTVYNRNTKKFVNYFLKKQNDIIDQPPYIMTYHHATMREELFLDDIPATQVVKKHYPRRHERVCT